MSQIKILKNRSDIGAGTRGADLGIDAMEIAAIKVNDDYFHRYPFVDIDSHNESIYNKVNRPFAKRIRFVKEQCQRVADVVKQTLEEGDIPIVLSGDHSSALGTMAGVKAAAPEKRMGVIWVDAHADLHSPFTSPSGNIHGMPLAATIGADNKRFQINEVSEVTTNLWEDLKNTGIEGSKLAPEDLIFFGVRDTEEPEDGFIEEQGIKNYTVAEMRFRGFEKCLKEAIEKLDHCDMIYISFDVDSLDCDLISYGTGTPVQKGFDPEEVKVIISRFLESGKVVCLELVEVNPLLDNKGNKMAETAFDVLREVTPVFSLNFKNI